MRTWTLKELKLADELCFPETFLKLWTKHSGNELEARYFLGEIKRSYGYSLIRWILGQGRAGMEHPQENGATLGEICDRVIADLLKK